MEGEVEGRWRAGGGQVEGGVEGRWRERWRAGGGRGGGQVEGGVEGRWREEWRAGEGWLPCYLVFDPEMEMRQHPQTRREQGNGLGDNAQLILLGAGWRDTHTSRDVHHPSSHSGDGSVVHSHW